jgi:hypothetical protein
LPGFNTKPQTEQAKATGTDGKPADAIAKQLTNQLTKKPDFSCKQLSFSGIQDNSNRVLKAQKKTPLSSTKTGFFS